MPKPLQPMPISSISTWDDVRVVDSIVDESENGFFFNSALLVDQVLRDDRIHSTVLTRTLGLLGKGLEFEPAEEENDTARTIAEDIETDWPSLFPHAALVELQTWGLLQGVGVAQILELKDTWTLEVWHPWALRFDQYKRGFFLRGLDGPEFLIEPDHVDSIVGGGYRDAQGRRWVLYTPYGRDIAGRRGLIRNLGRLYLERQWALRDRARYSEVHGQPTRFGIAPVNAKPAEMDAFKSDLGDAGSEPVVVAKQGAEGERWDMRLVEATGRSHDLFEGEIAQLDRAIATLILGQSQTVDGQAGLGANAQAGEPVRIDIMRADADTLSDALRAQFLVPYCEFMYGEGRGEMAPWPCWQVDPPEDHAAKAAARYAVAQADKLYIDAGVLQPERVALSRFGEGEYSFDTKLSDDEIAVREKILAIGDEQALEEAQNPQPEPIPPNGADNGIAIPAPGSQANGARAGAQSRA